MTLLLTNTEVLSKLRYYKEHELLNKHSSGLTSEVCGRVVRVMMAVPAVLGKLSCCTSDA